MNEYNLKITKRIFSVLLLFFSAASFVNAETISGKAADFTLKSQTGKNLKLSEYRGQVVMINFWASWCAPCRQEMPLLDKLYKKYKQVGFTILGVNVEKDTRKAANLLKDIKVSFPVVFDNENRVSKLYKVVAMPTTVLVDRDGNMRFLHKGYKPGYERQYEKQIKALLRE